MGLKIRPVVVCFTVALFLGLTAAAATLGFAASVSAASLLFVSHRGAFPYHFSGSGGKTTFETVGGNLIESASSHYLLSVLNPTLFDLHVEYLKVKEAVFGGTKCRDEGKAESVLVNMLGHFGFADSGSQAAVLLLVPSGFEYECLGGFAKVKSRGSYIGSITSPSLNTASELMRLTFHQTKGKQEFTTFLLGSVTLTNQFKEESLNGGAFEQAGQESEAHLLALPSQGTFLLTPTSGSTAPATPLFVSHNGAFPYHLSGSGGKTTFETVGGNLIESASSHYLLSVLNPTLFDLHVEYLKVKEGFGFSCHNDGKIEKVLINLLGHFGLADPGAQPAVLLLVPSGFEYECLGGFAKVKSRGSYIGSITSPSLNTASELMWLTFHQTKGKQEFTTFLLGSVTLTNQFKEESLNGGAFEQAGQESEAHLLALPSQGTFLLVSQ